MNLLASPARRLNICLLDPSSGNWTSRKSGKNDGVNLEGMIRRATWEL